METIFYRILEYNEERHSVLVRFWSDTLSEAVLSRGDTEQVPVIEERLTGAVDQEGRWIRQPMVVGWNVVPKLRSDGSPVACVTDLNIDLPIPIPAGDRLDDYVLRFAPRMFLEREERARNHRGADVTEVRNKIGVVRSRAVSDLPRGARVAAIGDEVVPSAGPQLEDF